MGISVETSGFKVEHNKFYLVNLNADPSLNELLVYYLKVTYLIYLICIIIIEDNINNVVKIINIEVFLQNEWYFIFIRISIIIYIYYIICSYINLYKYKLINLIKFNILSIFSYTLELFLYHHIIKV